VAPHGSIKLNVFDATGRQLDDGRIPHWALGRIAYPQVSFAGRAGKVSMVGPPRVVRASVL
jgi:hypothetical protein